MNSIYKLSSDTIVYLGESTPGSHILFEELNARDKAVVARSEMVEILRQWGGDEPPIRTAVPAHLLLAPDDPVMGEFGILLQRPWFKRVWVLQASIIGIHYTPCRLFHSRNLRHLSNLFIPLEITLIDTNPLRFTFVVNVCICIFIRVVLLQIRIHSVF
jgi:hypothetical protein